MRALCWHGTQDVRVEDVPDPRLINPRDAIVRVTRTAICGSDVHLYDGFIPTMRPGDILGHEFMGEVVDVGPGVGNLRPGDRVVVPFAIACGACFFCTSSLWSLCDNSNPGAALAEKVHGFSPAGYFGYSHMFGGYAGGQAQFVRVPFADVGPLKVPEGVTDEQVLFLSDIFPTGWQAAEQCSIRPGDVVAVWGCGPVGLFALKSARLLGAERVIAIDHEPERLALAASACGAEPVNFDNQTIHDALKELTGGRGPDACIDAVGLEAHGMSADAVYDRVKTGLYAATDRVHALRQAIRCCRKGGTVSIPGVYAGIADKFPIGVAFNKGLTLRMGQTHVHRYMRPLLELILQGRIDPAFLISHRLPLEDAPAAYAAFAARTHDCIKVVMDPWAPASPSEPELARESLVVGA
ncbi:MAG TPA: zinc-dependent alcohol dehydrogenase [Phycisphaerales bacterium]|nr:zinc-dependent alcohol dehydrogenase [Phycisphaerales bacterium]